MVVRCAKNDIGRIRTCAGEPNGFQVHRLNHSATISSQSSFPSPPLNQKGLTPTYTQPHIQSGVGDVILEESNAVDVDSLFLHPFLLEAQPLHFGTVVLRLQLPITS